MKRVLAVLLVAAAVMSMSACSQRQPATFTVPGDYSTIQDAIDHAVPGDLILVEPGTYHEEVSIDVKDVTIRGLDRNAVILDGEDALRNGFKITSGGVSIENLTIHSYTLNGIIFTGSGELGHFEEEYRGSPELDSAGQVPHLERFRVAYVTAYNNGLYGIYAFQSRNGVIEHSLASGHPDSGIYVGQCSDCNTVIDAVTSENNAIGYYGTNASGNVYVVRSIFKNNRLGVAPNSQRQELLSPERDTYVVGNVVIDNDNPDTPPVARGFFGGGIAVGGGISNLIARNYVAGHDVYGIGIVALNPFDPVDNVIEGNVVKNNGIDILFAPSLAVTTTQGNCFKDNTYTTSAPVDVDLEYGCDGVDKPFTPFDVKYPRAPAGKDYRDMPVPGPQTQMPGDLRTRPGLLPGQIEFPNLDGIPVPTP